MANYHPNTSGLMPPWSKTNQPSKKNSGNRSSGLRKFIKDYDLTPADVSAAIKFVMLRNQKELRKLITDEEQPFLLRTFAKAFLEDMRKGNLNNIQSMFDRVFGKPTQRQEVTGLELPRFIGFATVSQVGENDQDKTVGSIVAGAIDSENQESGGVDDTV